MLVAKNKKAYFDYDIIDSWEAGIELKGYEVKSIRGKQVNLKGSYVIFSGEDIYVKGMHISAYKVLANKKSILVERERKLFLHKKTISFLKQKTKESGFSLIPLEIYFKGNLIKVKIALVKGRKNYQKKQVLKERSMDRDAKMAMKKYL
ncbi:SsrA-binding protein [Candidatus Gracilibacteria bacterium]|nr:MAG: SsrA-binding protein [Candidatus Gracilibacteria bacterium]